MKYRDLKKILEANGFSVLRERKHIIFSNGKTCIPVPGNHSHELNVMLVKRILKQMKANVGWQRNRK